MKHQHLITDTLVRTITEYTLLALILELLAEQGYDCTGRRAIIDVDRRAARVELCCPIKPPEDIKAEVRSYIARRKKLIVDLQVDTGCSAMSMRELLRTARRAFEHVSVRMLKPYLPEGVEYELLVAWNGSAVILEAFESKAPILTPSAYVAVAHTHPRSFCIPSSNDAEAALDVLSEGGCCATIVSPACVFTCWREGPLTINDYDVLLMLSKRLAKVREIDEMLSLLNEYSKKLRMIKMSITAL